MEKPFWKNPCNVQRENLEILDKINLEEVKLPEAELTNNIVNQANIALTAAYQIKIQFISTIFKMEYDIVEELYKDNRLCFLPTSEEIPKAAGKCLSLTKLKGVQFSKVLPVIYTSLQKVAVGMEIVFKNSNYKRFRNVEGHLKNVLCEFYTAFKETKLEMPKDIDRDVVPQYYRNMNQSVESKIRDYIIFREYVNILEYTVQVFNCILQKYPTTSFFQTDLIDE